MMITIILVAVLLLLAILGGAFWIRYVLKGKDAADLARYLRGENCQWKALSTSGGAAGDTGENISYKNWEPESSGIEMNVYHILPPAGNRESEDEGVCLSIIDPRNNNGMILNGFGLPLDAMRFGDHLWNEQFLGDVGIMERMIIEKRADWDQMQREIIIGHYSLFM